MGKESKIRQERKTGLVEKPVTHHKDRFPVFMRIIAITLIVAIATWGSFFAIKSATGTIAYQVGTGKVLQSDITARVQNYIDMYAQYGMDLTTAANAGTLKSVRTNVIDSSIEEELFVQYAEIQEHEGRRSQVENCSRHRSRECCHTIPTAVWNGHPGIQ